MTYVTQTSLPRSRYLVFSIITKDAILLVELREGIW